MKKALLCVYHAQCDDGFGAAWSVRWAFRMGARPIADYQDVDFFAATYAGKMPNVDGRDVVFVDFCYPADVMLELSKKARSILVLDHHKSSMLDVQRLFENMGFTLGQIFDGGTQAVGCLTSKDDPKVPFHFEFDMTRSGARMAWDHFNERIQPPTFINYIQDHDLWTKELPGIDEFTAALRSYPMDFKVWDQLFGYEGIRPGIIWSTNDEKVESLIHRGKDILRYKKQLVEIAVKNSFWVELDVYDQGLIVDNDGSRAAPARTIRIRGANVPPAISSEVGEALAIKYGGIGLTWVEGFKWIYSLRSRKVGDKPAMDVSVIAKAFGGGGHHQASGFKSMKPVHRKWSESVEEEEL